MLLLEAGLKKETSTEEFCREDRHEMLSEHFEQVLSLIVPYTMCFS